jgi:hypothetical protein
LRLHLVVAVALGLVVLSTSHIYGLVWYYLLLAIWTVAALMTISIVWAGAMVAAPRLRASRRDGLARAGLIALTAIAVVFSARTTWVAPSAIHSDATVVKELGAVVPATATKLDRSARYLVAWDDAAFFGSPGYGLLDELDRRGFHVGALEGLGVIVTQHRVISEADATARLQLATGVWVDKWRAVPGATELASFDPRTPAQHARFDQLRTEAIDLLRAARLDDLATLVDLNLFAVSIDQRSSSAVQARVMEMLSLGVPIAVFLAPPAAHA